MVKNITMIGTGYVGLVTGACLADIGHNVTCVDRDSSKITMLEQGGIPIYEPGLDAVVARNVKAGRLKFSTTLDLEGADAVFLGVGTPTDPATNNADMSAFFAAAKEVESKLQGKITIVTKSTVPVGTGAKLKEIFDGKAYVASNPEFLREGNAVHDFMNPDRVVVGVDNLQAEKTLAEIYAPMKAEMLFTSIESAELIKYASNSFLATKVAFINEMADLCERLGADIEDVATGMGMDKRIGKQFLKAGPGIGGSCFPKDIRALSAQEKVLGLESKLVEAVIDSNERRKLRMADKIAAIVKGGTIAVFGLTFKANTDDMRESPSLTIIPELQKRGFKIRAYDPQGMKEAAKLLENIEYCKNAEIAAEGADAIVIMTEWIDFKDVNYSRLKVKNKVIIDLRNLLKRNDVTEYEYYSIGRRPSPAEEIAVREAV